LATVRIYKVAELLGTTSQEVTALLKRDHGIEVKSASSTIEEVVARQFVDRLAKQRNITLPTGDIFSETPVQKGKKPTLAKKAAEPVKPAAPSLPPPRLVKTAKPHPVPGAEGDSHEPYAHEHEPAHEQVAHVETHDVEHPPEVVHESSAAAAEHPPAVHAEPEPAVVHAPAEAVAAPKPAEEPQEEPELTTALAPELAPAAAHVGEPVRAEAPASPSSDAGQTPVAAAPAAGRDRSARRAPTIATGARGNIRRRC